jgi:CRP-like cAMP-binding protein
MSTKHDKKIQSLAQVTLFHGCGRHELQELAKITTEVDVTAGHRLCKQGDTGREFFVVVDGEATVNIAGDDVANIGPGGFFGEMALLDGGPRVATVTAASDMHLLVLSRSEFLELLAEAPTVTRNILEGVGARLRTADGQLHPSRLGV